MMTDFEIRLDPMQEGMDQRPPGANELLTALAEAAKEGGCRLHEGYAADAHNYICALETKVVQLSRQLHQVETQHSKETLAPNYLRLTRTLTPPIIPSSL